MKIFLKKIGEVLAPKTPWFWHQRSILGNLLIPLSVFYFLIKRMVESKNVIPKKFSFKTIFIGNLVTGGGGKTPTSIAIAEHLAKHYPERKICFVNTAYKAKLFGPVKVDLTQHNAFEVGDEAILLAQIADCVICKDRLQAANFVESLGYDIVIFDDGIHDKRIHKDLSFIVIDGNYGLGNALVFPAGPLRDRLDIAFYDSENIILIGDDRNNILKYINMKTPKKNFNIFRAFIDNINPIDNKKIYFAFAGLARPQKFFDFITEDLKLVLAGKLEFADHFQYNDEDSEFIIQEAEKEKATLITTTKDFVKLPKKLQDICEVVKIKIEFEGDKMAKELENLMKS